MLGGNGQANECQHTPVRRTRKTVILCHVYFGIRVPNSEAAGGAEHIVLSLPPAHMSHEYAFDYAPCQWSGQFNIRIC